jgi:hypothetical protein
MSFLIEYLSLSGTQERIDVRSLLSTRGWHDRRRRTFWSSDEGVSMVLTRDDRWISFTMSRCFVPFKAEPPSPIPARELSESEAIDWLAQRGFELPRQLQGHAPTGGTESAGALTPEQLTATMRCILSALKDLEAFNLTSARSHAVIVDKAGLSSFYTSTVRKAKVKLKEELLIDTQAGVNGGMWITSRGIEFLSLSR